MYAGHIACQIIYIAELGDVRGCRRYPLIAGDDEMLTELQINKECQCFSSVCIITPSDRVTRWSVQSLEG